MENGNIISDMSTVFTLIIGLVIFRKIRGLLFKLIFIVILLIAAYFVYTNPDFLTGLLGNLGFPEIQELIDSGIL